MKILRCREVFMALFFVLGTQSAKAQVDGYPVQFFTLNPTSWDQCSMARARATEIISALRAEISVCLAQRPSGRWTYIPECHYSGGARCAPLEARACTLENQRREAADRCSSSVREYQEREAALRRAEAARQSAEDAAASEILRQRDSAFTMAQNAFSNGDVRQANAILNRYVDPNDPTRAPLQIHRDGRQVAGMLGVSTSRGMQLQGHFQTIGMNAFREMTGNVVRQLDAAGGSGAFALDQGEGGGDNSAISRATPLAGGGYGEDGYTPEHISALSEIWQSGDIMGQILVAAAIIADIAAIYQSEPADRGNTRSRPSLIAGTFAQNIGRLSEAAARGDIAINHAVDTYATLGESTSRQVMSQVIPGTFTIEAEPSATEVRGPLSQPNVAAIRCILKETVFDAVNQPFSQFTNSCDDLDIRCNVIDRNGSGTFSLSRGGSAILLLEAEITSCNSQY